MMAARKSAKKPVRVSAKTTKRPGGKPAARNGARKGSAPAAALGRTVTPYLAVDGAERALEWYGKAFGAKVLSRQPVPGGKLMHASMQVGDSVVMLSDIFDGSPIDALRRPGGWVTLHINHKDIDRLWDAAVARGATITMPIANMFWGERYGKLTDPFGHHWSLGYPVTMAEAERKRGREEAMQALSGGHHPGRDA
jgi:uncharacterized glyoxalase superfamily protein PhnB